MTNAAAGIALLAAATLLASCSSSGGNSSGNGSGGKSLSQSQVNLGIADTAEGATLIRVAEDKGFWSDAGLKVNVQVIPTGPAQLAGIAGGSLQFAQSGPSTTMVPIQGGKAKVEFIGATETAIPWQLVISKSYAAKHGITQDSDPEQILPKLSGSRLAGVSGPTDSIATLSSYFFAQYGVTGVKTSFLGSPTAMFAALTANRVDSFVDVLGTSFQAQTQDGAIVVNLASLKKLPYITEGIPSFFTVSTSFAKSHGDTVTAFLQGLWKAWAYVKDPANESTLVSFLQKKYNGTSAEAAKYFLDFFARTGMWMSQELWQNTVSLTNTTLKPPLTLTYTQAADPQYEKAAVKALGLTPPHFDG